MTQPKLLAAVYFEAQTKSAAIAQLQAAWKKMRSEGPSKEERPARPRTKKIARTLTFDTPQEAQDHMRNRNTVAPLIGGLAGGALGAHYGHGRAGIKGALGGALLGGLGGAAAGSTAYDTMHDIPDRTVRRYHDTRERLQAASGGPIRIASVCSPRTADAFADIAKQDDTHSVTATEQENTEDDPRMHTPGWGPTASLEAGDTGTRTLGLGLPRYNGV